MKRIALALVALALMSSTAMAYMQPGQLPQNTKPTNPTFIPTDGQDRATLPGSSTIDPIRGINSPAPGSRPGGATNPVPEPGTMMLASMGLIALGAAVHRRRH